MGQVLEAVYERGVLRPLEELGLAEHQRVVIELRESASEVVGDYLKACHEVYEGLSDDEVDEVEAIALDRSRFLAREP